jgi:negative regulator of flagellin synthesis FlgM
MSSIDTRSTFFPKGRGAAQTESTKGGSQVGGANRNSAERTSEIMDKTSSDAKVNIGDGVKEFARIKKAAMSAPETDNSEKIARLKAQIAAGTYEVDYDGLADKILSSEF